MCVCPEPEAAAGGIPDRGSDPPEGSAGRRRLLHPEGRALCCGGRAQDTSGKPLLAQRLSARKSTGQTEMTPRCACLSAGDQQTGPGFTGSIQPQGAHCGVSSHKQKLDFLFFFWHSIFWQDKLENVSMRTVIFETCLWTQSDWKRRRSEEYFLLSQSHCCLNFLFGIICISSLTGFLRRYMVKPQDDTRLVSLSLQQFVKSVSARTAAPGGGSVSAAVAALV